MLSKKLAQHSDNIRLLSSEILPLGRISLIVIQLQVGGLRSSAGLLPFHKTVTLRADRSSNQTTPTRINMDDMIAHRRGGIFQHLGKAAPVTLRRCR